MPASAINIIREIVDQIHDMIIIIHATTGELYFANASAVQALHLDPQRLQSYHISQFDRDMPTLKTFHAFIDTIKAEQTIVRRSNYRRPDGSEYPVKFLAKFLTISVTDLVVFAIHNLEDDDASETQTTIELMQQIDQLQADLNRQNERVSMVAHEIKNPLHAIHEGISVLADGVLGALPDDQRQLLTMVQSDIARLQRLTQNLLNTAKIDRGALWVEKKHTDLYALIEKTIGLLRLGQSSVTIRLNNDTGHSSLMSVCDPDRIQQILNNLIGNALKAVPERNGVITIDVTVSHHQDTQFEIISVTDNGIGIAHDVQKDIFKKFAQIGSFESRKKGTGLGLAITKDLVRLHGGKIWVESNPGSGASFKFSLPHPRSIPKLLIIDPEPHVFNSMPNTQFTVQTAQSASEGLQCIKDDQPDLIFLNAELPDSSGFQVFHLLKQDVIQGTIPVIFLCNTHDAIPDLSGLPFLQKPIDGNQLADCLLRYFP